MKGEFSVINHTKNPNTVKSLISDFKNLGVSKGSIIILHSSLSKIGWTIGGAVSVIKALQKTLTHDGTLVMPSFSSDNSDPYRWENPPVPESWWGIIRQNMPAFSQEFTPTRGLGTIPETFRKFPDVYRSDHPMSSFAAWGKHAKIITKNHGLTSDLGEGSPLAHIYNLNGYILLLGVNHSNNTSLHLAEYRSTYPTKGYYETGSAITIKNERKWVKWKSLNHYSDDFERLGKEFEEKIGYTPKKVGLADSRLISQPEIVDFAVEWMKENR
ncbi:MAG: AAC(3) family N-acetyltransferase [Candidatus Lokiarchaeota archaeon]